MRRAAADRARRREVIALRTRDRASDALGEELGRGSRLGEARVVHEIHNFGRASSRRLAAVEDAPRGRLQVVRVV